LSASDSFWTAAEENAFFVRPVRPLPATTHALYYNPGTGEISYGPVTRRLEAADEEEEGSADVDHLAELDAAKARLTTLEARNVELEARTLKLEAQLRAQAEKMGAPRTVELEAQVRALAEKMEALLQR
jgi:hypothetical protein